MRKYIIPPILGLLLLGSLALQAQKGSGDYLGLPGDNLNLYAVMNLFQESETLEGFERKLNDPEQLINNLDLNNDGFVDYIMVNDYQYEDGRVHNIVLSVALNANETQDVAVFVVEKQRDGSVIIQLIGDEALYGKDYIIEPQYAETPNPGFRGRVIRAQPNVVHTTYYEVASWPVIVYITRPVYRPWRSVWYWGYYPGYWNPWRVHYWHYYYGYHYHWHAHYYALYRPWKHYRVRHYHHYYYPTVRRHSPLVVININRGVYKETYSRPETRKEGEAQYALRNPVQGRVPGNGRSPNDVNTRQEETRVRESTAPATRQNIEKREAVPVENARSSQEIQRTEERKSTPAANEPVKVRENTSRNAQPANTGSVPARRTERNTIRKQEEQRNTPAVKPSTPARPTKSKNPAPAAVSGRKAPAAPKQKKTKAAESKPQARPTKSNTSRGKAPGVRASSSGTSLPASTVRSAGSNTRSTNTARSRNTQR